MLSHLTGIRPEVPESDRAKLEAEVGVLLNALVAHGQHLGPAPPVIKLFQIMASISKEISFPLVIHPSYHVTEGFGCPYARHRSVAGAPRLRYISVEGQKT